MSIESISMPDSRRPRPATRSSKSTPRSNSRSGSTRASCSARWRPRLRDRFFIGVECKVEQSQKALARLRRHRPDERRDRQHAGRAASSKGFRAGQFHQHSSYLFPHAPPAVHRPEDQAHYADFEPTGTDRQAGRARENHHRPQRILCRDLQNLWFQILVGRQLAAPSFSTRRVSPRREPM